MKRNVLIIVLLVLLAGVAVYQNSMAKAKETNKEAAATTQAGPKVGQPAPAFTLDALDGKSYQVGGTRDKPMLLNFWASWCGPCEEEAPTLQKMQDKYKDQLDIYAVNVTKNDVLSDVKDTVSQYKLSFPILLDKESAATDRYQVQVLPTNFLIDRNGNIVDTFHLLDPAELEKKIKDVIKKD